MKNKKLPKILTKKMYIEYTDIVMKYMDRNVKEGSKAYIKMEQYIERIEEFDETKKDLIIFGGING